MTSRAITQADISGSGFINAGTSADVLAILAANKSPFCAPGLYDFSTPIIMNSGQTIFGSGPQGQTSTSTGGTIFRKTFNGDLIDMSGTAVAARKSYMGLANIQLHGNSLTGRLIKADFTDHLSFQNVYNYGNNDCTFEATNMFDARFDGVTWEQCYGSASFPVVHLSNAATDSTNAVWFNQCRWETFKYGALKLNGNSNNIHSIYLNACKMETGLAHDVPFIDMTGDARNIHIDKLYSACIGLDSGTASLTQMLHYLPFASGSVRNVQFYNTQPLFTALSMAPGAGGGHAFDNIVFDGTSNPTNGGFINCENACDFVSFRNIRWRDQTRTTAVFVGAGSKLMGDFIPANAGAITDAFFPNIPPNGQLGYDSTNNKLYIRAAGAWKSSAAFT